ncbi:aromatic compound dioxygenase [Pyronema domesticum]|uniref:Similar to extracellular dioxygenase [Aspergillus kawachii IFO 4308] acc. no. GAA87638 n=1 Tax=Pyronema omphalodes (strain CBS 100304) TaxID=1076935 RepID=U4L2M4_PYROM|nr:aromatic compound dioxygenase [Pyronema domesticum]CCX09620.1 Similar to extracellular dioxygenase [Aspergillus kawachii IFO 4308]; acc. no. GAA87638 [Pyronema omphalodes CBS 100304]
MQIIKLLAALTLLGSSIAHPGGHEPEDLQKREALWQASKRSLADCSTSLKGRGLSDKAVSRREELAKSLRIKRGLPAKNFLKARSYDEFLATNHHSSMNNGTGMSYNTEPAALFTGNTSCILSPEVTQGPYFVTGEKVRHDVRENQQGVDLYLDMQFIDINTCEPVNDIYVDIWHANATGVYSGVVASGNGNAEDTTNLDATFLRGLWKTNEEGVVQFLTLFPGHYTGRAHHTHVIAHQGGYVNLNGTFSGGNITHVGQLFYDTDLQNAVELNEPYLSNTQDITSNADDMWASQAGADEWDPFVEYVYLGEDVKDGILGWISIGLDTTQSYDVSEAATLTENGGVVNDDFGMGGGAGGPGGMNGTDGMPSGTMPSGMPPSGMPMGSGAPAAA